MSNPLVALSGNASRDDAERKKQTKKRGASTSASGDPTSGSAPAADSDEDVGHTAPDPELDEGTDKARAAKRQRRENADGGSGSSNQSLFEHLHVPHANGRDITDPLCRYLSNDYEILKGICKAPAARIFDLTMKLYFSDAGA